MMSQNSHKTWDELKGELGEYLSKLREDKRMSIREVVDLVNKQVEEDGKGPHSKISRSWLGDLESGKGSPPNAFRLDALAEVYGDHEGKLAVLAGFRSQPLEFDPKDPNEALARDIYFDNIAKSLKSRPLTKKERHDLEEVVKTVYKTIIDK